MKTSVKFEPKSKLSSDDWRCLGEMAINLQDQERFWMDKLKNDQLDPARREFIIGMIYPKITVKSSKKYFKDDTWLFIARDPANIPIGYCCVQVCDDEMYAKCNGLYVKPNWRKMGIGTKLLECAMKKTKDEKLESLELRVSVFNKDAKKLYDKLGFSITCCKMEKWL